MSQATPLTPEQVAMCAANHYLFPKMIDGQLCALHQYAYTVGLLVDVGEYGYERRYCFENWPDAIIAITDYENVAEHAPGPWIKCKGRMNGEPIDLLNPEFK